MNALTENVKSELLVLCAAIEGDIENANYGGCGIVAERLYLWLAMRGIGCKIIVLSNDQETIHEIVKNNDLKSGCSKAHIVLKVNDDQYVDSTGISYYQEKMCGYYPQNEVPLNVLVAWNVRENGWNPQFDRKQIPRIDKLAFPLPMPEFVFPPVFA